MDRRAKGFTLVEMLVVIAISALLMSIMMPALGKVKKMAQATICMSNLKHWGVIWKMFVDDNNDKFMENLDWIVPLEPYYMRELKIFLCPAAKKKGTILGSNDSPRSRRGGKFKAWFEPDVGFDNDLVKDVLGSYGDNMWITHATGGTRLDEYLWKTPSVKGAWQVPIFFDCAVSGVTPWSTDDPPEYDGEIYLSSPMDVDEIQAACINRHPIRVINMLFADWAARKVRLKELWDPECRWYRKWPLDHRGAPAEPPVWPEWMDR